MFRKLVSNLAFSPALVGQLGFYAQRLRKEEATRKIGLIFTALALVVQSFAVFSPPEAANAASANDMVYGGISDANSLLKHYDGNTNNIKDLYKTLGITREDIINSKKTQINSKNGYRSWGMNSHFSYSQGERQYTITTSSGGERTYHERPLNAWDGGSTLSTGSYYNVIQGVATGDGTMKGQYFAVILNCGNLVLKVSPPAPKCPTDTIGNYPNCSKPKCPTGTTGTYPNCVTPKCPTGTTGTYPNCVSPKCPTDTVGTYPNCIKPVAKCESLKISRIGNDFRMQASSSVTEAKVTGYTFTISKDGKVLKTLTYNTNELSYVATYTQTEPGTYSVKLTVHTNLGDKTSDDCASKFTIAPPKMCPVNDKLPESSPDCQPCPGEPTLWIKDENCSAKILSSKSAKNITQGDVNAETTTAKAGDKIVYTLSVENAGNASSEVEISERLADVLEYAKVIDNGGGVMNVDTKTMSWPKTSVEAHQKISRMFTVQVLDNIPAMGQGTSDRTSYDCRIDNTFGNTTSINIDCPVQKVIVEQTVSQLPHTGPGENMLFAGIIFSIVAYFYARSRQLKKEVRLIRRDLNAGTI